MKCFNKVIKKDGSGNFLTGDQIELNKIYLVKSYSFVAKDQWFEAICVAKNKFEIKFIPTKDATMKFPHLLESGNSKGFTRKPASIPTCVKEYK